MKKRVSVIVTAVALLFVAFFGTAKAPTIAVADTPTAPTTAAKVYMQEFLTANRDRTPFSGGEEAAAGWLRDTLVGLGFYENEVVLQDFSVELSRQTVTGRNVIARIAPPNYTGRIILGAHYDNTYSDIAGLFSGTRAEGASDNGSGVGVLLAVAERLVPWARTHDIAVDVVFFGASEAGGLGAQYYAHDLYSLPSALNDTLLVLNLDCVAAGDYLYVYTDEVERGAGSFIQAVAAAQAFDLRGAPKNKHTFATGGGYGYAHMGLMSDNTAFIPYGVNTANFFAGNWETSKYAGLWVESEDGGMMTGTPEDTLNTLASRYATYAERMDGLADVIYNTVTDAGFAAAMRGVAEDKLGFFKNPTWARILAVAAVVLAALALILAVRRLQKKYPAPPIRVVTPKIEVFGSRYEGEEGRSASNDDIFGR